MFVSEQAYEIISCTKCGQKMKVPTSAEGKAFKCVRCGNIVRYTASHQDSSASGQVNATDSSTGTVSFGSFTGLLSQWLVTSGLVTSQDLEESLEIQKKQGGYLLKLLYQNGKLPAEMLFEVLSRSSGFPKIDINRLYIDKEIVELVPKKLCEERFVFPVDRLGRNLTLAMACPIDKETVFLVEQFTQLRVKPTLVRITEVEETINKYFKGGKGEAGFIHTPSVSTTPLTESRIIRTKPHVEGQHPPSVVQFPEETFEKEKKNVELLIDELEYLPIPPTAELALSMVLDDSSPNIEDLSSIFADEPSLATALLRWANTSIISEERKTGSIWTALTLLGPMGIQVMMNHIKDSQQPISEYPVLPISGRSKLSAKLAEKLAQNSKKVSPSLAYTTALIHQIGAIVLYMVGQEEYKKVMKDSLPEIRLKKESEYFTINHAVTASLLASRWKFPEIVVHALCHYLEPYKAPGKSKDLAHILFISSIAGLPAEQSNHDEVIREALRIREKSIQYLGLDLREVMKALG